MHRRVITMLALAGLMVPFSASGHDPSKHKGKATTGQVASVANDRFELKTKDGVKTVLITEKTKFERGNQAASLADLKKGDSITVMGTTLASGELSASEVLLKPAKSQGAAAAGAEHGAGHKH
ncbi:MAG: hypothetical protein HY238_01155 [Acidobacteria bacterium]|nr:hypothetical protein [Acidobacteriota bacterium]